jgi:hypothetical protein
MEIDYTGLGVALICFFIALIVKTVVTINTSARRAGKTDPRGTQTV